MNNRRKLLDRVKDSIRNAKPVDIDSGGVQKSGAGHGTHSHTNPIKVGRQALSEPTFHYDPRSGEREIVLIGNDKWLKGDEFPMQSGNGGGNGRGNGNGPGENGEDDFIINISRSEFYNVFFEDCELPDLKESHDKELPEFVMQRAGFQKVGNPGQLSIIRSFKLSLGRRNAMTLRYREELDELLKEQEELLSENYEAESIDEWAKRLQEITLRIAELKANIGKYGAFEDIDLRYRKSEKVQVKATEAVFGMMMDVSGSMGEEKKRMARKFFVLQYAFIKRKYPQTDLIFIAHTDDAEELSEEEFFTTRLSGGTTVSPAFKLMHKIIKERYDSEQTNIYLSYAGDGDNWESDNANVIDELEAKGLLAKVRHAVYLQVGTSVGSYMGGGGKLWNVMQSVSKTTGKLALAEITDENEVFDIFKKIYKKQVVKK